MSTIAPQRPDAMAWKPSEAETRALAFDLYKQEGGGDPMKHWLKAEEILKRRHAEASAPGRYATPKPAAGAQPAQSPKARQARRS
jgi:hypothetical protein